MNGIVHFEIPADDLERAQRFYKSTFGWKMNYMKEMDYTIVLTTEVDEKNTPKSLGVINGGMMKRSDDTPSPVITIEVASIDDAMKRIEAGGGSVVHPRQEIPGMGAFAYFKDSEGNTMGLWESAR